jgi:pyrimidine-nucleoside phosphorylase
MDESAMRQCIERKRGGDELTAEEWQDLVASFMSGAVDEAQMAALCMACVWQGMSFDEAFALTRAMVNSGETITFDRSRGLVVDKHSSGAVGDIVSLVAVPLAAACGAHVAKLSGRALGHTGGTIDKLETITGFQASMSPEAFVEQVDLVGCAIVAQSEALVPADKRLYRLRDRTATIPSLGLIAASIVSKKIAGGAHAFVFDVKTGAASFVPHPERARELARWLLEIAARFGRPARAFVTDASQPLGRCIGTGIEVVEAREFLRGNADPRAREVALAIAAALVSEYGDADPQGAVRRALDSGKGYEKFVAMIAAQKGDVRVFEGLQLGAETAFAAPRTGYVCEIDVVRLGNVGRRLSGTDPLGGLRVAARIGDRVEAGDPLVYALGGERGAVGDLASAFVIGDAAVETAPLIYDVL